MTRNGLLNSVEALEILGIYNPSGKAKPKTDIITWLVQRGLLKRIAVGPRTFRYRQSDCEKLLEKSINEGINLRLKPC
jgi:hypothetical protein